MLSIGITTFKRRFELLKSLVNSIKSFDENIEIIITINADYEQEFDENYRKSLCEFISSTKNCYPVFFPSFTSLSKMWNTLILHSTNEHILILNDDLIFDNENIIPEILNKISNKKNEIDSNVDLFTINNSWCHFVISKKMAYKLKYFDERLLAWGEEDGDMVWRFIKEFGEPPTNINIEGIRNLYEGYDIQPQNIDSEKACRAFRPKFNRHWAYKHKYKKSILGIKGMFDYTCKRVIKDEQQYPYEKFKWENKDKLIKIV